MTCPKPRSKSSYLARPGPSDTRCARPKHVTQACASGCNDGATLSDWGQQQTSFLEARHWSGPLENGADFDRWYKVLPTREKKRGIQAGRREARSNGTGVRRGRWGMR